MSDDDFAAFMRGQAAAPVQTLTRGSKLRCRVIHVGNDSVFVELGTRAEGRIPRVQLQRADGSAAVAVGDMVEATVVDPDGDDGPLLSVMLTRDQRIDLSALEMALESGTPVEGRITQALKGGVEVDLAGIRAFCPASQAADTYVADLSSLVGEAVRVLVTEIREGGRSVVVSRRKVLQAERAQAAKATVERLEVGAVLKGSVTSLQKYGAFVDIGGVEGLVHISELSTSHVNNAEDVVNVGERVQVKVLSIEQQEKGPRVRLSMKALQQTKDPTDGAVADEILKAKVVRMLPHGVVVATERGEGMIPMRELDLPHGSDHRRAFAVDQELEVTWLGAPSARPRFSVSRVEEVRARKDFAEYRAAQAPKDGAEAQGPFAALLGHMDRGKLPTGPKNPPKPKPVPKAEPQAQARPNPQPRAAPAAAPKPAAVSQPAQPPAKAQAPAATAAQKAGASAPPMPEVPATGQAAARAGTDPGADGGDGTRRRRIVSKR